MRILKLLCICLCLGLISTFAQAADVSTTFPNDQTSGQFTLGTEPKTVTFTGGEVRIAGITSLYRSGSRAYMVRDETAVITFGTPARELLFYIKAQSTGNAFVRLLDEQDNELLRMDANASNWTQVHLVHEAGIHEVEFTNLATDLAAMEDFEYTAQESDSGQIEPIEDPITAIIEEGAVKVTLETMFDSLVSPVTGALNPTQDDFVYIVDQVGQLYSLQLSTEEVQMVADFSSRLVAVDPNFDERGFLGFAFHPDFTSNGLVYTYTSEPVDGMADFPLGVTANHQGVIAEWQASSDPDMGLSLDMTSRRELVRIDQPQFNHNGGTLTFDHQGMLLISLGDGGSADDQGDGHSDGGNGQDMNKVLGKILRIDPTGTDSNNGQYGIPSDNPYLNDNTVLDEIWVSGVRNPYRISVSDQQLYVCDVGQNDIEEITLVSGGENLGWPLKEGSFAFSQNGDDDGFVYSPSQADLPEGLTDPNWEYDHDEGIAIVCGFEYQGDIEALQGSLIFGDWVDPNGDAGRLFYTAEDDLIAEITVEAGLNQHRILGFAPTASGDVLVLSNQNGVPSGQSGTIILMQEVPNQAPLLQIDASPMTADEGQLVTLSAEGSEDPDGDSLFYVWTQTEGPQVTLSSSIEETVTFTAPDVSSDQTLTFMLEVSDGHLSASADIDVTVQNVPEPTPSEPSSSGGGGALGYAWLLVLLLFGLLIPNRASS